MRTTLKSILLFIISILFLSCQNLKQDSKPEKIFEFNVFYHNGDTIRVSLPRSSYVKHLGNSFNDNLHLLVTYYKPAFGDYDSKVYKLKRVNDNYNCEIIVPDSCADMSIRFLDHKTQISGIREVQNIMIFKKDNSPNIGTYDNVMFQCKSIDEINKTIFEYQKYYPSDLGIYVSKWQAGMTNKFINRDSISNEIKLLKTKFANNSDIKLIEFIAEAYTNPKINFINYLKFSTKYKSKLFNNWSVTALILDIANAPYINESKSNHNSYNQIIENFLINNPYTFLEQSIFKQGGIHNYKINREKYVNSLKNRLNYKYDTYLNYALLHAIFFNDDYNPNIQKYCENALLEILDSNIYINGRTTTPAAFTFKSSIVERLTHYFITNGQQNNIDKLIKHYQSLNKSQMNENYNKMDYSIIMKTFYEYKKDYDSTGVYYLLYSDNMMQTADSKYLKQLYSNSLKNSKSSLSFEEWSYKIREISSIKLRENLFELPYTLKIANYQNQKIELDNSKIKILEYFSSNCSPCIVNLKSLSKLSNKYKSKLQVIYITGENPEIANKILETCGVKDIVPNNSKDYIKLLGVNIYPTTIFLDKNNKIIHFKNGGGTDMSKEVEDFVKNYYK